jgi:phosphate transport system substrate-binding protein
MKTTHSSFTFKRVLPIAIAGVGLLSVPLIALSQSSATKLIGTGATFPERLYKKAYFPQLLKANVADINYSGTGSGTGIKQFIADSVDFGASDAAMTDAEISQAKKGALMIPTAGGPVAVPYKLEGVKGLKLSKEALYGIFSGKITKWNDATIASANSGVSLPDKTIKLIVRADSSGTSFIFSNYLNAINPSFKASKSPNWAGGNIQKAKNNDGVASAIASNDGSIGYVELAYANKLTSASIQNSAGEFVAPSVKEASKALEGVSFPPDFRASIQNPAQGYPITGITWLLLKKQYEPAKRAAIVNMVKWILTKGQTYNEVYGYTTIPKATADQAISAVESQIK